MSKNAELALRVVTEWNQCHGAFYFVDAADLRWNLEEQDWLEYRAVELAGVPALLASPSAQGVAAGLPQKTLWLSLYGRIPAGKEPLFVEAFVKATKDAGKTRAHVGGEEFHFVAGIPVEDEPGTRLAAAFAQAGFANSEAADFGGSLLTPQMAKYISEAEVAAKKIACTLTTAKGDSEFAELGMFLLKEFPGRWEREFRCWKNREDTKRAYWNILREKSGKVLGFSRLAVRGRIPDLNTGWNPGALRLPIDDMLAQRLNLDSCLGPIGISASERGRGAGKILLGLSLQNLLINKADRVCIDWTNAYTYYTPLGVTFLRKFHSMWKDL
jgi:hypothetical protein